MNPRSQESSKLNAILERPEGASPIKVATWNVNSLRARMPLVEAFLADRQPDVLLLQELKGLEFPTELFLALGYHSDAVTQKTYNGVAILARQPVQTVATTLPGDVDDSHARYLETMVAGIRMVNIYLPNGNPVGTPKFDYKLAWMERLLVKLAAWRTDPVPTLIGGDFNVIPEDLDCDKPANWTRDALFQPETRERFRSMLGLGYTDAFRHLHPEAAGQYTYWDYFRDAFTRNRGIRIDHFLLSAALVPRLEAAEIDRTPRAQEKPSDHTPLLITLAD